MQVVSDSMFLFWQNNSPFSNWYPVKFQLQGVNFQNSETAFMWLKANHFGDKGIADQILASQDPRAVKALGRQIKNYVEADWNNVRFNVMYVVNKAKFEQNPDLEGLLIDTGYKTIAEASPYDLVWGIGLLPKDPLAQNRTNWKGLNLLGEVLMKIRSELI